MTNPHLTRLRELLAKAQGMAARGEINLNQPLEITIDAERNADGTLRDMRVEVLQPPNDKKLKQLAGEFTEVLSESRALSYFKEASHLQILVRLNEQKLFAQFAFNDISVEQAARSASNYNSLFSVLRLVRRVSDEGKLFENMRASANGNRLTVNTEVARDVVAALLAKQLPSR